MKSEEVGLKGLKKEGGTRGEQGCGLRLPTVNEATQPISPVDRAIQKVECLVFPGTTTTVCCLTMKNGFHIIGMSDCVNPAEFDQEIGMKWAIQDARDKAEGYVAYLRKERRYQMEPGRGDPVPEQYDITVQKPDPDEIAERIAALRKKVEGAVSVCAEPTRDRSQEKVVDIGSQRYTRVFSLDDHNFNAHHLYAIRDADTGETLTEINFQLGPIKEHGVNGIHHEDLIAICLDRLQHLNLGRFSCRQNALAITKLEEALLWLRDRTRERENRGVEGTKFP